MCRWPLLLYLVLLNAQTGSGLERLITREVASRFLTTNRTVRFYLPPSYANDSTRRFPVLYVHDGQNAFSFAGTNVAFGWGSWQLDKIADELGRSGKMREVILVAVDNTSGRYQEYSGKRHSAEEPNSTGFDNYAAFLIQELKPLIDAQFHTLPDAASTGALGSSLGGLCSIALAWEYPEVFGRAASLSGSFQVEKTNFLQSVLRPYQGKPKPTRIYLDSGIVDFTGGDDGRFLTDSVAAEFRRIGWGKELMAYIDTRPLNLVELEQTGLRRDKWAEAQTSQHNEFYWRLRVWRALTFLFPATGKP